MAVPSKYDDELVEYLKRELYEAFYEELCGVARPPTPDYRDGEMMTDTKLKPGKFVRRPFYVDAVRVTAENMKDVAEWCGGDIRVNKDLLDKGEEHGHENEEFIKVRVYRPMGDRQTMAFVGDWVLYAGKGYKVYTHPAFEKTFAAEVEEIDHVTNRSAISGEFVTAEEAAAHPDTTVTEHG